MFTSKSYGWVPVFEVTNETKHRKWKQNNKEYKCIRMCINVAIKTGSIQECSIDRLFENDNQIFTIQL